MTDNNNTYNMSPADVRNALQHYEIRAAVEALAVAFADAAGEIARLRDRVQTLEHQAAA